MGFFDDDGSDPFEDIMNEFFGRRKTSSNSRAVQSEAEERVIDYIEEDECVYFVFELPGFREEDVEINLKGDTLTLIIEKKNLAGAKNYLHPKLGLSQSFSKKVPVKVKKEFTHSFKNGILEVKLKRK